jgi:hypothetical protein
MIQNLQFLLSEYPPVYTNKNVDVRNNIFYAFFLMSLTRGDAPISENIKERTKASEKPNDNETKP